MEAWKRRIEDSVLCILGGVFLEYLRAADLFLREESGLGSDGVFPFGSLYKAHV